MRLFGEVTGEISYRDAAMWLYPPFDPTFRKIRYPSSKIAVKVGPADASVSTAEFTKTVSSGLSGVVSVPVVDWN
jgi:hypothetical protein